LAPCRKNSKATAAVVKVSKLLATWPVAGKKLASSTVATSIRVKLSGRNFMSAIGRRSVAKVKLIYKID
jgi:hypothetical protein